MKNFNNENTIALKDIKGIGIEAKRWFQSPYGNTYHSVVLSAFDGSKWVDLAVNTFEYGYGDHYTHTALRLLQQCLSDFDIEINKSMYTITTFCREHGITLHNNVEDVKRKKDL